MSIFPFKIPLVLDGATGTNLMAKGLPQGVCVEEWILDHTDVLENIQTSFIKAGSDALYAPTFGANSITLANHGLQDKMKQYNSELVRITKKVAESRPVGGNLSPTGVFMQPFGDFSFAQIMQAYNEQAAILYENHVDFFVIETMTSLSETRAAVLGCAEFGLPIFVTVTVDKNGRMLSGETAIKCLACLQRLGISAFGLNCSFGPENMKNVISSLAQHADIPIIAKPNAGLPREDDASVYDLSSQQMAGQIIKLLRVGATIVGGCCGTTPEHIKAIRSAVDKFDFDNVDIDRKEDDFGEDLEVSDIINCSEDMSEELLDLPPDTIARTAINTVQDAQNFALNAHYIKAPVMFTANDQETLDMALLLYNGIAFVDSDLEMKYGAIKWKHQ